MYQLKCNLVICSINSYQLSVSFTSLKGWEHRQAVLFHRVNHNCLAETHSFICTNVEPHHQPLSFLTTPFTVVSHHCNCWPGYKLPSPSLTDALKTMKTGEGHDWWKPDGEVSNMPRGFLMIHRSQLATWLWKITMNTLLQGFCSFLFHQYFTTAKLFSTSWFIFVLYICFILYEIKYWT